MTATAANFDTEKFRKVAALMTGGAKEGERAAAKARTEAIAGRAGMTLKQAMAKIDSKPAPKSANFFEGFDDWMEEKEPGYKARQAQKNADRKAAVLAAIRNNPGLGDREIADIAGVTRQTVNNWRRRFRAPEAVAA